MMKRVSKQRKRSDAVYRNLGPTDAGVVDAVVDQNDNRWVRYGRPEKAVWFSIESLIADERNVFRQLSRVGVQCLTLRSRRAVLETVQDRKDYREALVAVRPGWVKNVYVTGDGTVHRHPNDSREIIVAFELNPKFEPVGTLAGWKAGIGPVVSHQGHFLVALAAALAGPLLRYVPSGYVNPFLEFVGPGERGKTSLGKLAASVTSGNPDGDAGGGESWNLTSVSIDVLKRSHSDGLLFLDEGSLAGTSRDNQRDFIERAVFQLAGTASRRRFGDSTTSEHVNVAIISTTNRPLSEVVNPADSLKGALHSRLITIPVGADRPHGVLSTIPKGYASARAAIEELCQVCDHHYGVAGAAFLSRLVRAARNEDKLRGRLERRLDRQTWTSELSASARVQKTYALLAVSFRMAVRYGIIDKSWGSITASLREVCGAAGSVVPGSAIQRIENHRRAHNQKIVDARKLSEPHVRGMFDITPGYIVRRKKLRWLIMSSVYFKSAFDDHHAMLRELRGAGLLQIERGRQPKTTVKTPRSICRSGRAVSILLPKK